MILLEIKRYLQQRGEASVADIALQLDAPPEAIKGMLETLLRKGRVRRQLLSATCGSSCGKCDTATTERYIWVGNGSSDPQSEHPLPMPEYRGRQKAQ
ncbi:MAG: sugar metabolism transcriptional regulator [Gammaproteobacteria bacterium]|nr:sugar metabolism transcriptional regulator [Gammaproteobacteria bacterium]